MIAVALACSAAATWLGMRDLRTGRRTARPGDRGIVRRVVERYDRSRAGRRLAARLWRAQIHMSPAAWRCAQLLVAVPVTTLLIAAGAPPVGALTGAGTAARSGASVLLRLRRRAAATALDEVAPVLARALATELAAWGSGVQAVTAACRRCSHGRAPTVVARVLEAAAVRVALGGDPASSLHRALDAAAPNLRGESPASRVTAVFALHRHDVAATAVALERLATALEADGVLRNDVRAATGEVRMSAVAVPLLAAATLAMLLATDPPALAAALTLPVLPLLGGAAVVVVLASLAARRVVST
jgi:hypothetical protein